MNRQAHVNAVAELDAFRASLIVYLDKAGRVLDDVQQEVVGTRLWLQSDRQVHWKHEIRKRTKLLNQAEQELFTARLSGHPAAVQDRRRTVERARRAVTEAEQRLTGVKSWLRQYESHVDARLKAVTRLRQTLTHDMQKAVAFLDQAGDILADYAELSVGSPGPTPAPDNPTPTVSPRPVTGPNPSTPEGGSR
jgi:hypothetical protein